MHPAVFGILANIVSSAINSTLDESGSKAFNIASSAIGNSIKNSLVKNYKQVQKLAKNPDPLASKSSPQTGLSYASQTY